MRKTGKTIRLLAAGAMLLVGVFFFSSKPAQAAEISVASAEDTITQPDQQPETLDFTEASGLGCRNTGWKNRRALCLSAPRKGTEKISCRRAICSE